MPKRWEEKRMAFRQDEKPEYWRLFKVLVKKQMKISSTFIIFVVDFQMTAPI